MTCKPAAKPATLAARRRSNTNVLKRSRRWSSLILGPMIQPAWKSCGFNQSLMWCAHPMQWNLTGRWMSPSITLYPLHWTTKRLSIALPVLKAYLADSKVVKAFLAWVISQPRLRETAMIFGLFVFLDWCLAKIWTWLFVKVTVVFPFFITLLQWHGRNSSVPHTAQFLPALAMTIVWPHIYWTEKLQWTYTHAIRSQKCSSCFQECWRPVNAIL